MDYFSSKTISDIWHRIKNNDGVTWIKQSEISRVENLDDKSCIIILICGDGIKNEEESGDDFINIRICNKNKEDREVSHE